MQVFLPDLHQHLKNNKIPTDIYASNWFITMFSNDLPFDMAPSVLDVYLLEGHKGLLRISLSLLCFLKHSLLTLQYDDLMVFLSHPHAREEAFHGLDQHALFATAFDFKITNNLLKSLERLFKVRENLALLSERKEGRPFGNPLQTQQLMGDKVREYLNFRYFNRMQLCAEDSNRTKHKYRWLLLMLSPDDVDDLMANEGL